MKILHVITSIDPKTGGTAEAVIRSSQIIVELGHEVEVASIDSQQCEEHVEHFPWKTHCLGPGGVGSFHYSRPFRQWLLNNVSRFDVVIIHGLWQHTGFAARQACRQTDVPYFVYTHGMLDPWFNKTYPLKKIKKYLYWRWGEYRVLRDAQAVLFTCEEERNLARTSFSPYKVHEQVVGLGTSAPEFDLDQALADSRAQPKPWAQRPYFLFMSRIQEKKGLDLLVAAYAKLRSNDPTIPELVIAGPIQQQEYADKIKTNYTQDGIHWIGTLSGIEKWQALAAAEAMTLVSHQENFGIVIAEALAVGTPVLISNKINIWREIEQGGAGLVANDSIEGAQKILGDWLSQSTEARQHMVAATTTTFQEHFEIQRSTQRLITCIQSHL
tara:strand:- start:9354 stop:10505 length:1152 start_codon:yes stop_codon:yes gene_type:complete